MCPPPVCYRHQTHLLLFVRFHCGGAIKLFEWDLCIVRHQPCSFTEVSLSWVDVQECTSLCVY